MSKSNPSIPFILQISWDETLKSKNIMIILCGSAMSFIEKKILSQKSPLCGRATGIYKMNELPFSDAIKFFPNYSAEDKMLAYSILGGIPHYLAQFDPSLSLQDNIINNPLSKGCALYSKVEFLIRQELLQPLHSDWRPAVQRNVLKNCASGSMTSRRLAMASFSVSISSSSIAVKAASMLC